MKTCNFLFALFIIGCANPENQSVIAKDTVSESNTVALPENDGYKLVSKDSMSFILNHLCDSLAYEFTDMYPDTDSIPYEDYLQTDDSLKQRGFEVIHSGRGNWMNGPRIVIIEMKKEDCKCEVVKLYYSPVHPGKKFKVRERLHCYQHAGDRK